MYARKVFERYLTVAQERQLLAAVRRVNCPYARRDAAWMLLLRHTGIRVGTLTGLTVADARQALRSGYLTVRPEISKGGHGGRLYLNKKAVQALNGLLAVRRELGHAPVADAPLLMSRKGQGLSKRSVQERMQTWCAEAGLAVAASPHWWRHTLAKRLMKQSTADDPRGTVQRALLHSDINTSLVYTMPDREDYEQAMEDAG